MLLPLPNCLADPDELDLLPEKIEITVPSFGVKIAHPLLVRAVKLGLAHYNCAYHTFLPNKRHDFASQSLHIDV